MIHFYSHCCAHWVKIGHFGYCLFKLRLLCSDWPAVAHKDCKPLEGPFRMKLSGFICLDSVDELRPKSEQTLGLQNIKVASLLFSTAVMI